jgi:ATP-binding cassette, subfamily C, bacteriocin exporter
MKRYFIKQEDEMDCGACSLLSIIKYYKGNVPLEVIKVDTLTNKSGTTFYNIKEAAIKYGFAVKGILSCNLDKDNLPCIVQLKIDNYYHFVVVYEINKNVIIMDPSYGLKKISLNEFNNLFTGYILYLYPIKPIVKYHDNKTFKKILNNELIINKKLIIILIIISISLVIISLLSTLLIKFILNNYNHSLIYILIVIIFIKILITYLKNLMVAHLNKNVNINIISNYFNHIFNLPFKYLQLKKKGDLISRINDLNNIKEYFSSIFINMFINILFFINSSFILIYLNKKLTIIIILITLVYYLIAYLINRKIYQELINIIESETLMMDIIVEDINNIWTIKIINKVKYFYLKLKKYIINNYQEHYKLDQKYNLNELIVNIYDEGILFFIIISSIHNSISSLLIFIFIFDYFNQSIKFFINFIPNLMYFKSAYNRISSLYVIDEENSNNGFNFTNGDILISNLNYKLNLKVIFNNYNLNIKKGNKVLLIGDNGSGKTTLLNILFNNINDYKGLITINNIDIKKINIISLKEHISYVSQNDNLFNDTILNNIILNEKYNETKFKLISEILSLDLIFKDKYNGNESIVNDNLSGGEKQRIILARAIYRDFDILLLDEALSEVSYNLRLKIIAKLNKYFSSKTIIYVSHNFEKYPFDLVINLTARKEIKC